MNTQIRKKIFTTNSLVNRFFLASIIILPLFIILSGTLLLNAFQHSQINAEQEKLQAHIYLLLSVTEIESDIPLLPDALIEPRFNQQNSGLYAFIFDDKGTELWRSASSILLAKESISTQESFKKNQLLLNISDLIPNTKQLTTLSYDVEWINDNNISKPLRFVIASDSSTLITEIQSYRKRLWQGLGLMGLLLIISQLFIMRWGLSPIKRLQVQLEKLQQNKIQHLEGNYPIEIQPVIDNFNSILDQEKHQRERYRNTMADLAHSLKTPLAVIQSQQDKHQDETINEQLHRINQIISHQLQRAVIRSQQSPINHKTDKIIINKVVNRLIKILSKVYQEKNIIFSNICQEDHAFYGDEADLLEVLGNLLDNACKHGNSAVTISTSYVENQLTIMISDNGKGINPTNSDTILQRGERADTAQPGQGIGLSVAVDIISSYGGEIRVENNAVDPHLSGACFSISFYQ